MTYLALLIPLLALPALLAFAAFEVRCSDRTPLVPLRRSGAERVDRVVSRS